MGKFSFFVSSPYGILVRKQVLHTTSRRSPKTQQRIYCTQVECLGIITADGGYRGGSGRQQVDNKDHRLRIRDTRGQIINAKNGVGYTTIASAKHRISTHNVIITQEFSIFSMGSASCQLASHRRIPTADRNCGNGQRKRSWGVWGGLSLSSPLTARQMGFFIAGRCLPTGRFSWIGLLLEAGIDVFMEAWLPGMKIPEKLASISPDCRHHDQCA